MKVEIIDVAARDGLQNEKKLLPTAAKVELIERLVSNGSRRLEAASFVHPGLVPAMADAEAVMSSLNRVAGVSYIGLALNERGLERAIAAGCDEVAYAVGASNSFSKANQGTTIEEGIAVWKRLATRALDAGVKPTLVVSVAFGCPYEGEVEISTVARVVEDSLDVMPARLSLADTIGVGTPADVKALFSAITPGLPADLQLGTHFHNTRNTGIANAYAALEMGIRSFDSSLGGVGGCPFAPNATGNVCTEDLVFMFHRMGLDTGLDLDGLAETAHWLQGYLGDSVVGLYSKAGPFPS